VAAPRGRLPSGASLRRSAGLVCGEPRPGLSHAGRDAPPTCITGGVGAPRVVASRLRPALRTPGEAETGWARLAAAMRIPAFIETLAQRVERATRRPLPPAPAPVENVLEGIRDLFSPDRPESTAVPKGYGRPIRARDPRSEER